MTYNLIASLVLLVTVSILIIAEIRGINRIIWIFKPVSTLIVISIAVLGLLSGGSSPGNYGILILTGLIFSLGGDVILMPPDSPGRFRSGLVLFLTAHVLYIAAFWGIGSWSSADLWVAGGLVVIGVGYYLILLPKLGSMKIPVAIYVLIISLMVSRALSTLFVEGIDPSRARLIAVGAVLFFVSDVLLSANRFWKPWKYERISLAFYFSGQLCLALSVVG